MSCQILQVDPLQPEATAIARAACILQDGGLVAFPTETVYGLGANALDEAAVARIFAAKGRPAGNPVIVHVATAEDAKGLVRAWPVSADRLASRFWPGSLTLVLPKADAVPAVVTADGPTVAVRMPAHPVALALLRQAGVPIAAPSANASTELSPTRAEHVLRSLGDRIDLLLDAGPTIGGLESTVLDLTTDPPRLLRPGLVTLGDLAAVLGQVQCSAVDEEGERLRSPGQMRRHYAPKTPLAVIANSEARVEELCKQGLRVGWLTHRKDESTLGTRIVLPANAAGYAGGLYAALHQLDAAGLDRIIVEAPPDTDDWLAVRDRLGRAATCG